MRIVLSVLLIFGIVAGISAAVRGPRWGWHGYGYSPYYGAPCGWYYPQQPGAAPAAPGAAPPATPGTTPPASPR
jgi:hypothetical protein